MPCGGGGGWSQQGQAGRGRCFVDAEDVQRNLLSLTFTLLALLATVLADNLGSIPPIILDDPPARIDYRPGRVVTLSCRAHGSPAPRYEWRHNNQNVSSADTPVKPGDLVIHTKPHVSAGYYQCLASNELGVAVSGFTRLVQAEFGRVLPSERWLVRNFTAVEGAPVRLPCNHTTGEPRHSAFWYTVSCTRCHDEQPQPVVLNNRIAIDDKGSLVLLHVEKIDSLRGRLYKCLAYNPVTRTSIGGSYSHLTVQNSVYPVMRPPSLLYQSQVPAAPIVGDTVILRCFFDGVPSSEVGWSMLSRRLSDKMKTADHGRQLILTNVREKDSGKYECQATNSYGTSAALHNFTVYVRPQPYSSSNSSLETVTAVTGGDARVACLARGSPPLSYHWLYNARPLNLSSLQWQLVEDSLILLSNISLEHTGLITCNVSSPYGYSLVSFYLYVQDPVTTTAVVKETSSETETTSPTTLSNDDIGTTENMFTTVRTAMSTQIQLNDSHESHITTPLAEHVPNHGGEWSGEAAPDDSGGVTPSWAVALEIGVPLAFLLLVGGALLFVFLHLCGTKSSYPVRERERHFGCNEDYDSDDSGYEEKEERSVKRQLKKENSIQAECHV